MPFIRRTRDKGGHETTYVMHSYRPTHQEPNRTRVLYLFRSPAHLRVGREPLDAEVKEALEHTHPDMSFDWTSLVSDAALSRQEPGDRNERFDRRERGDRSARRERPRDRRPAATEPAPPPSPSIEDESVLGRVLGPSRAAQLRQRYADLVQRITRRARTPEERDRLTERCQRLNPDEWPDEGAVRSNAQSVEAEWEAITAELPSRRRGRRGGRRRSQAPSSSPAGASHDAASATGTAGPSDEASGIMDEGEDEHEDGTPEDLTSHGAGASDHRSPGGPAVAPDGPTDADLQVDDGPDHD